MEVVELETGLRLPEDLIMDIISRSDYQTATKCRVLSKRWNTILTSYDFLSTHYQRYSTPHPSLFIHLYFPHWEFGQNAFLRVSVKEGRLLYLPVISSFWEGEILKIHGIANGNMCLSYKLNAGPEKLAVCNMLTGTKREIPQLPVFPFVPIRSSFAFAYLPSSIHYCIVHTFKNPTHDEDLLMFNIYYSEYNKWTKTIGCDGNVGNIGVDYLCHEGNIYWINYSDDQQNIPHSVIMCSAITKQIDVYPLTKKCLSGKNFLLAFNNQVCIASHPLGKDDYTFSVWSLERISQTSIKWKSKFKLGDLKIYDNPMLFIGEELISLTDQNQRHGSELAELIISSFRPEKDYERFNLLFQDYKQVVQARSIKEYCQSIFPT